MRKLQLATCVMAFAVLGNAQEKAQTPSASESQAPTRQSNGASVETAKGSPDDAKVTGSTFHSDFFKFTYELPKDWKALDDAVRVKENQQQQEEDKMSSAVRPTVKPKTSKTASRNPPVKNPAFVPKDNPGNERYSLLVASPNGVDSLASPVLPRMNIWAHRRIAPLDNIDEHAQYLAATKRAQVLFKPKEVSIGGHTFMRIDILSPTGEYHSQFVTAVGDYLIGFDFLTTSEKELSSLAASMDAVKFQ